MERIVINDPVGPADFLGDPRGAIMGAPRNLRIECLALEGMPKNRLRIRLLLEIRVVGLRLSAHAYSIANQAKR